MRAKTALVLGATGLTGSQVVAQLLADDRYEKVVTLSRRPDQQQHPKLATVLVDFEHLEEYRQYFAVDELYCCLGTTMKNAGSEAAFKRVDYEIPLQCATIAKEAGLSHFLMITAMGADTSSYFFYNRVKGEIERDLLALDLPRITIVRPGLLLGERAENRWTESMAQYILPLFNPILPAAYKPITAETVARAMIRLANTQREQQIWGSGELQEWGAAKQS